MGVTAHGMHFLARRCDNNVLGSEAVRAAQLGESTKNKMTVHFIRANFVVSEWYLNKGIVFL